MKNINLPFLLWLGAMMTSTSTATPIANKITDTLPRGLQPDHSLAPRAPTTSDFQPGALVMSTLSGELNKRYGTILSVTDGSDSGAGAGSAQAQAPAPAPAAAAPASVWNKVGPAKTAATSSADTSSADASSAETQPKGPGAQVRLYEAGGYKAVDQFFSANPTHGFFLGLSLVEPPLKIGDKVELKGSPTNKNVAKRVGETGEVAEVGFKAKTGECQVSVRWSDGKTLRVTGPRTWFKLLS